MAGGPCCVDCVFCYILTVCYPIHNMSPCTGCVHFPIDHHPRRPSSHIMPIISSQIAHAHLLKHAASLSVDDVQWLIHAIASSGVPMDMYVLGCACCRGCACWWCWRVLACAGVCWGVRVGGVDVIVVHFVGMCCAVCVVVHHEWCTHTLYLHVLTASKHNNQRNAYQCSTPSRPPPYTGKYTHPIAQCC